MRKNEENLVEENLGLVRFVCRRFQNRGLDMEDVFQAGCLGLCKAAEGFKEELGFQFSTYAVPLILGEIQHFIRSNAQVHMSRAAREKQLRLYEAAGELSQKLGREASLTEAAGAAGMRPEEALLLMESMRPAQSLEEVLFEEGTERAAQLKDGRDEGGSLLNRLLCGQLLDMLSSTERLLVSMRYFQGKNQTEAGERLGLTQVQVSRLEKRILKRLREACQS
ncbi:MAG: sigma-70 family RNA polymerase sigma factor [Lachnospiraceae bacterium]|nr:sigma-70 family RNA polymerase sigma factor [Lachnospiraceae bacterium]